MTIGDLNSKKEEIERLVSLVKEGDHEAFSKLYDIFVDPIYRYIFYKVDASDAEDIVENVFLKVWENIRKYKPGKNFFSAWVFKIAHNLVVDHYRGKDRAIDELDVEMPTHEREHDPIKVTESRFDNRILRKALFKIKKEYQEIILYKFVNELSNKEISEILGKSEGSLRILQHRALRALKVELDGMGVSLV